MNEVALPWGAQALWQQLSPLLPGLAVEVVASIGSTNSALLERARAEQDHGEASTFVRRSVESTAFGRRAIDWQPCLLVAEHQTAGRGRLGRSWRSTAGASLTFSLAMPLHADDWSGLSLAVGAALADSLDPPGPAGWAPRIGLKWPNDLWLVDAGAANGVGRKLGGILVETVSAAGRRRAVVGVGVNVQPVPGAEAIALPSGFASLQELLPAIEAPQVLARVARPLVEALQLFERAGFGAFADRFAARDILLDRKVSVTLSQAADGTARGIAPNGALRVETDAGTVLVDSGEVSVRLQTAPPGRAAAALR